MVTFTIKNSCPSCQRQASVEVNRAAFRRWIGGEPSQNAFPELSPAQRELILTGFCEACWEPMWGQLGVEKQN